MCSQIFSEERVSPRSVVSSRPNSPTISHGSDLLSASSSSSSSVFGLSQWQCQHCNIIFPDQTLYFLHRGFHSNSSDPWKCNGCAKRCTDMYDFNTHLMSEAHHWKKSDTHEFFSDILLHSELIFYHFIFNILCLLDPHTLCPPLKITYLYYILLLHVFASRSFDLVQATPATGGSYHVANRNNYSVYVIT